MAISLSSSVKNALAVSGEEIGILIKIQSDEYLRYFCNLDGVSAGGDENTEPATLYDVSPVGQRLDPLTRKAEIGGLDLIVGDAVVRDTVLASSTGRLTGAKVTVTIGHPSIAVGSWSDIWVGFVDDHIPDGMGQTVTIRCLSLLGAMPEISVNGYWLNMHPLEVIEDILVTKGGLDSAQVDTGTLDPSDADYSSISHYVVSHVDYTCTGNNIESNEPYITREGGLNSGGNAERALDMCNDLAFLCGGSLTIDESNGKIQFKIFDSSASSAADWTKSQYSKMRPVESSRVIANKVTIRWNERTTGFDNNTNLALDDDPGVLDYSAEDTAAQADVNYYGGPSSRVIEYRTKAFDWLQGYMGTTDDAGIDTDTDWSHWSVPPCVCGTRDSANGASQASDAKISSSRKLYLKAFKWDSTYIGDDWNGYDEVLSATAFVLDTTGFTDTVEIKNPDDPNGARITSSETFYWDYDLSGATRGVEGTAAAGPATARYDITIQYNVAHNLLDRIKYGLDVIEIETPLVFGLGTDPIEVELGDLVTIENDEYIGYGLDGIDSSTKWEVIQKDLNLTSSPPHIKWRLAST